MWFIVHYSLKGESWQINWVGSSIQNHLTHGPAHCWGLLYAMTTEPIGKYEVAEDRMSSDDPILIKGVIFVESSPSPQYLYVQ